MRLSWKTLCLAVVAGLGSSGCSGIDGSYSVSPASFFLPGLVLTDRPQAAAPDADSPALSVVPRLQTE